MKSLVALSVLGAAIAPAFARLAPRQEAPSKVTRQPNGRLAPITVEGNMFKAGGKRFYVQGVAYQPGGAADAADPLLDHDTLENDIKNFVELGINTLRIYTIDNSGSDENRAAHKKSMEMLDEAGIYLALDANTPKYSLNRESEATLKRSYNDVYLSSVFATMEEFVQYDNLFCFFSGNEVIDKTNNTNGAPFIKAVTRDMKQYNSNHHKRKVPIGYSAADVSQIIEQQALYFDCGEDDARADFFAFNDYSWCDFENKLQTFEGSGWDKKVETYKNYAKPIFLSEHGCIEPNRQWGEVTTLFSSKMSSVYSGGLAYEYTLEANGYGIVEEKNGKIVPNEDFKELKAMYDKVKFPTGNGGAKTSGKASECPPEDDDWNVGTSLPALPRRAADYMDTPVKGGPGLKGDGSHFAGEASQGTATAGSGNPTRTPGAAGSSSDSGGESFAVPSVDVPLRFAAFAAASVFGAVLIL